ncbi:hypothetical protein ALQ61_200037 [Pseudomonas coronafaciens pv. zizaniae]|nr:hypothetical protein ALQ61_200037 [Pseudomonas coronafaciens pv. zizaniae]
MSGKGGGVVDICGPVKRDWVLRDTSAAEVLGIGRKMKARLEVCIFCLPRTLVRRSLNDT